MVYIRDARTEDAVAVARVHVDSWKTAYQRLFPQEVLGQFCYEEQASKWAAILSDPKPGEFTLLAVEPPGKIVGFASGGPERKRRSDYEGELYALYLLHSHRGRGIGARLFFHVAARLEQAGVSSMLVWVLEDNPHRRFYANMGGRLCARGQHTIGGKDYSTVAYGWNDWTTWRERTSSAGAAAGRAEAGELESNVR